MAFANAFFDFFPNIMAIFYSFGGNVGTLNFFEVIAINHFSDKFGDLRAGKKLEQRKSEMRVILIHNERRYPSIKQSNRTINVRVKFNNPVGIYPVTNIRFLEACDDDNMNELNEIVDKKVERPQRKAANVAWSKIKECC